MKSLREQFVDHLKENIESKLLIDINNHHENYINWLENKVKQSEEEHKEAITLIKNYYKWLENDTLQLLLDFVKDKMIIIGTVEVKKWFENKLSYDQSK